jgi:KilA-N domain
MTKQKITVMGLEIVVERIDSEDYISLTDIAKQTPRPPAESIRDWLRNTATLLFLQTWESLHNNDFKVVQMHHFRNQAADNRAVISPQRYIEETGAVGLTSKSGRYGGTFAHSDIATNFCNWLSPEFQVYFIKEFKRLKEDEAERLGLTWNLRRELAKANYPIHTEAVRTNLVPMIDWNTKREGMHFANEADLLNLAVFGTTAKQWREANPDAKGNIRDSATEQELQVLSNMESANALLIDNGFNKEERFAILSKRATRELDILAEVKAAQTLKKLK